MPFQILTRVVQIKKGTLQSGYGQLYLAFATSAFLHHFPILIQWMQGNDGKRGQLAYFLIQPLAIIFEDIVIHLRLRAGFKQSREQSQTLVWQPSGLFGSREDSRAGQSMDYCMVQLLLETGISTEYCDTDKAYHAKSMQSNHSACENAGQD